MQNLRKTLGLNRPKPKPPASPPSPPPRPAAQEGAKPKKPEPVTADGNAIIEQACGHRISVRYLQQRPCDGCCARNRSRQQARRQAKRSAKRNRLPDNACFHVLYDATTESWTGTLTIGDKVFEAQARAVFRLLATLDTMYRDSVPQS